MDRSDAGPFLKIQLSGTLNEALIPEHLAELADGRPVLFDLEKVSRITSFGVRQWMRGLASLRERSAGLVFERCSYPCVAQLNLIADFSADALIVSVMAPLRCTACQHEKLVAIDVSNGPPADLEQPCEACGAKAELEEDLDSYFAFTRTRPLASAREELYSKLKSANDAFIANKAAEQQRVREKTAEDKRRAEEQRLLRDAARPHGDQLGSRTLQAMQKARGRDAQAPPQPQPRAPTAGAKPAAPARQTWQASANFDMDYDASALPMQSDDDVEEISDSEIIESPRPAPANPPQAMVSVDLQRLASLLGPAEAQAPQSSAPAPVADEPEPSWFDRYGVFIFAFAGGVVFGFILGRL